MQQHVGTSLSNGMVHGEILVVRKAVEIATMLSRGVARNVLISFESTPDVSTFTKAVTIPGVRGFIVPQCSPYSHLAWAISYFDAATMAFDINVLSRREGPVYLDLDRALVFIPSTPAEEESLKKEEASRMAATQRIFRRALAPATSQSGVTIKVLAQIQSVEDVGLAYDNGAGGVGEMKPELLLNSGGSAAEIVQAIRELTPWQTIPIRFFDYTNDKPSFEGDVASQGPLAYRGIRLLEIYEPLMDRFLRELETIAGEDIVAVLPMVTLPEEVESFRDRITNMGPRVGVLVETPAAALTIEDFIELCDYIEIGINDLTQFTMAWDRTIPHKRRLPPDRLVEPVARLVARVSRAAQEKHAFCALALDLRPTVELARQLLELGVPAITVSPRLIPLWKEAIRNSDLA